jgi:hypothetical protein
MCAFHTLAPAPYQKVKDNELIAEIADRRTWLRAA